MSAKHTPGPWRKQYEFGFYNIEADSRDEPGKTHLVAAAVSERDVPIFLAAPELLEALKRARPHIGVGYSAAQRYEITKLVDAAIAKAEGQQ